jgi:hypothetical protein
VLISSLAPREKGGKAIYLSDLLALAAAFTQAQTWGSQAPFRPSRPGRNRDDRLRRIWLADCCNPVLVSRLQVLRDTT